MEKLKKDNYDEFTNKTLYTVKENKLENEPVDYGDVFNSEKFKVRMDD